MNRSLLYCVYTCVDPAGGGGVPGGGKQSKTWNEFGDNVVASRQVFGGWETIIAPRLGKYPGAKT